MTMMFMCLCISLHLPINFTMPKLILMKPGTYIMVSESISAPYLYNSLPSICVSVCPLTLRGNGSVKMLPLQ
jgi:hypothetical protein